MRQAHLQLSVVVVYPADTGLKSIRQVLEEVFDDALDISDNSRVGGVYACIIDVQVPGGFSVRAAKQRIKRKLPAVRIKVMRRFRESWWARHRWGIAIGMGVGLAVALITELARQLAARMREAPG